MLVIKLQRVGKKHQPGFRFVVSERRSKLGGPPREDLGSYNSLKKEISVNKERLEYWLRVGAKMSPTVNNVLVGKGVLSGKKVSIKIAKPKTADAAPAPSAETPKAAPAAAEKKEAGPAPAEEKKAEA